MTAPAATHIWLNGRLLASEAAHLSAYDRGFQLGDGVFEALRARRGVPIELESHMARLHRSLSSMGMDIPYGAEAIAAGISELLAAEGWDGVEPPGDAAIRLTISRGFDPTRGVAPHSGGTASVAIQAWPFSPPSASTLAEGLRLVTSVIRRDPSSPISGIKTTSRAELVYARLEAERAGAHDAIFLTTDGRMTEATTSNVLLIRGDVCATPRLGTGLLAGTARAWLLEHGVAVGLRTVEQDLRAGGCPGGRRSGHLLEHRGGRSGRVPRRFTCGNRQARTADDGASGRTGKLDRRRFTCWSPVLSNTPTALIANAWHARGQGGPRCGDFDVDTVDGST